MKYRLFAAIFAAVTLFSAVRPTIVWAEETEAAADSTENVETAEGTSSEETSAEETEAPETEPPEEEISTEPPEIKNVNAACVYNIENDRFIYDRNSDKVIFPASTVKLMTAIVAIEELGGDLSREITVEGGALVGVEGNRVALRRGEILTLEQLLYCLICGGANDAANVLAFEVAGSVEAFTVLMNEKAKEIGALNTRYANPTGMHDPSMVTTARDTAIIGAYAYSVSPICEMASVEKFVLEPTNKAPKRTIFNKNYYFSTNVEYLYIWKIPRGLNAGYTPKGGNCLVTTATRNGLTYVVVCMGAASDDKYIYSYTEGAKLVKWSFNAYDTTKVLTTSDLVCEVDVRLSSTVDTIGLFPSQNVELYLPTGIDVKKDVELKWELNRDYFVAPVSEGTVGGTLTVYYNGDNLGTYELVTKNSVSRNNFLYIFDLIYDFVVSSAFNTVLTAIGVILAVYILGLIAARLIAANNRKRRR